MPKMLTIYEQYYDKCLNCVLEINDDIVVYL